MPNIKPVSDLRNYNEVLRDIAVGEPVFLTKNGRGRYAIVDIEEYEKTKAVIKLMGELTKGEKSAQEKEPGVPADLARLHGHQADGRGQCAEPPLGPYREKDGQKYRLLHLQQ